MYHPKHVEQFPDKINCVTLHLVGYRLEYGSDIFSPLAITLKTNTGGFYRATLYHMSEDVISRNEDIKQRHLKKQVPLYFA